jgi:hypothetical protein
MNSAERSQIIAEANAFWQKDQPVKAGMLIFERISLDMRPQWAAAILELAYPYIDPLSEIDQVFNFVREPESWSLEENHKAHGVFDAVRRFCNARGFPSDLIESVCRLAENVAGITYTSRQFNAPFDHNRGWLIAQNITTINVHLPNLKFLDAAWQVHCAEQYILLDAPISCNRGCPICHPPKWDYLPNINMSQNYPL